MITSFNSKFCPASDFFRFGNKKTPYVAKAEGWGSNSTNLAMAMAEVVKQCVSWWNSTFFSPNRALFYVIQRLTELMIQQAFDRLFFLQFNQCRSRFGNPRKRCPSPFRSIAQSTRKLLRIALK